jgi:Zn-finger nucleic acid-binding protein
LVSPALHCPVCRVVLRRGTYGPHVAARCPSCEGAWFTVDVVRALRADHLPGEPLEPQAPLRADALPCPRCKVESLYSYRAHGVCVSVCERCRGAFLEGGDLRMLERAVTAPKGARPESTMAVLGAEALGAFLTDVLASYIEP